MASHIKRGETLYIPFRDGQSVSDSQLRPRMYKSKKAFLKSYPGYYLGTAGVKLVEYAEIVRCEHCKHCTICYPEKQIDKEPTPGWYCKEHKSYRRPDDFCSYGEGKDDA